MLTTLLLALSVQACTSNANNGGGGGGDVVVSPIGNFSNLPPTPAPTPPPPPPPIAIGWVPAPPRGDVQDKTRHNCKKRVDFFLDDSQQSGTLDITTVQEEFEYTCGYQVYVEVKLFNTKERTHCSCGLSLTRQMPPADPNFEASYSTEITRFNLVVYDVQYKKPLEIISAFKLDVSANSSDVVGRSAYDSLKSVIRGESGDAENYDAFLANAHKTDADMINVGFFGDVDKIDVSTIELLKDIPENRDHVAAMCFNVEEKYRTAYRWPEPPRPALGASPNAFTTNCVPFYPPWSGYDLTAFAGGKRWHDAAALSAAGQVYWFREYLLFANKPRSGIAAGVEPKHRYLTSYFIDANCGHANGVVTFDREFDSVIERNPTIYGAFDWTRTYVATGQNAVGGVPRKLAPGGQYSVLGFHQITWSEHFQRVDGTGAFIKGKLAHMINGTQGTDPVAGLSINGLDIHRFKLCKTVPAAWFTCEAGVAGCANTSPKYGESAYFWNIDAASTLDCTGIGSLVDASGDGIVTVNAYERCASETTYLSFQNAGTGAMARDFSKKPDSWLLTGPRSEFCTAKPSVGVFDSLVFQPIKEGAELKRAVVQASKRTPKLNYKRDANLISAEPEEAALGPPEAAELITKPAAGSADNSGRPGGDHPMSLFPETYTVPVSLDPNDLEYSAAKDGWVFDGKFSPCLQGTQGCNCRDREGRPKCDAPLVCTSEVAGMESVSGSSSGFCVDPPCEAGKAGCDCIKGTDNSNTCANDNLQCDAESYSCVYKVTCAVGDTGCLCKKGSTGSPDTCNKPEDSCFDGFCLAFDCPEGLPGCACDANSKCFLGGTVCKSGKCGEDTGASLYTTANKLGGRCGVNAECAGSPGSTCDTTSGFCVGPRCTPGSSGCRCNVGKCTSALDECTSLGVCLTQTCEPGSGGCQCYQGQNCASGFECSNPWDGVSATRKDRCIRERCEPGTAGCPCQKTAAKPCSKEGFNCLNMLAAGSDYKCVALGHQCGNQIDRCLKFCGASNVLKCPGCSHQVPVCKPAGSTASSWSFAAVLALLAVFVQLF